MANSILLYLLEFGALSIRCMPFSVISVDGCTDVPSGTSKFSCDEINFDENNCSGILRETLLCSLLSSVLQFAHHGLYPASPPPLAGWYGRRFRAPALRFASSFAAAQVQNSKVILQRRFGCARHFVRRLPLGIYRLAHLLSTAHQTVPNFS